MMIISERTVAAMNDQIQSEFHASSQYVAMAIYFDEAGSAGPGPVFLPPGGGRTRRTP